MSNDALVDQPLVGKDVVLERPIVDRDPFEALDDLMTVVEALCPEWPARKTFANSSVFLI